MKRTNKILVVGPITAAASQLEVFKTSLKQLMPSYDYDVLDPLQVFDDISNQQFYQRWHERLSKLVDQYDGYIGFSFGAVVLLQTLTLFEQQSIKQKPLILFSAPMVADSLLFDKLTAVIKLAEANKLQQAEQLLMSYVFAPHTKAPDLAAIEDEEQACQRLVYGLNRALTTDCSAAINAVKREIIHFIGADSQLVTSKQALSLPTGKTITVPNAGMRVLQDNPDFCQQQLRYALLDCHTFQN